MPNAGQGLKRLSFKQEWDVDLREYMKKLDAKKPVILCGDLNVAHLEIGKCPACTMNIILYAQLFVCTARKYTVLWIGIVRCLTLHTG